jgi:biotin transport system substrate-specific component
MKLRTKDMIIASLFAALTIVGGYISIPIGTIPITLQYLFVALSGILLGGRLGALSQLLYVLLGLIGLPVFSGGAGGIATVLKPSFGYLIGFVISAYVIGRLSENYEKPKLTSLLLITIIGNLMVYVIGVTYMYFIINIYLGKAITIGMALKTGFIIFVPGDIIKCMLVAFVGARLIPIIKPIIRK